MIEGLYQAKFYIQNTEGGAVGEAFGKGVMHFRDGNIVGGDSEFYYLGKYSPDFCSASIKVRPHSPQTLFSSPFGIEGAELSVTMIPDFVGVSDCAGTISHSGNDLIRIKFTRL